MTRRELVKAAIEHRSAERVPYYIHLCPDTWENLKPDVGAETPDDFLDNDVVGLAPPWWRWHELGVDWADLDTPASPAKVIGTGSYEDFVCQIKQTADWPYSINSGRPLFLMSRVKAAWPPHSS